MQNKIIEHISLLLQRAIKGDYINLEDLKSLVKTGQVQPRQVEIPSFYYQKVEDITTSNGQSLVVIKLSAPIVGKFLIENLKANNLIPIDESHFDRSTMKSLISSHAWFKTLMNTPADENVPGKIFLIVRYPSRRKPYPMIYQVSKYYYPPQHRRESGQRLIDQNFGALTPLPAKFDSGDYLICAKN